MLRDAEGHSSPGGGLGSTVQQQSVAIQAFLAFQRAFWVSPVTPSRHNPHPVPPSVSPSRWQQHQGFPADPTEGIRALVSPPDGTARRGTPPNHPQPPSSPAAAQKDPTRLHPPISHGEVKGFLPWSCETIAEMGLLCQAPASFSLPSPARRIPRDVNPQDPGMGSEALPAPTIPNLGSPPEYSRAKGMEQKARTAGQQTALGHGDTPRKKGERGGIAAPRGSEGGRTERHRVSGAAAGQGWSRSGPICCRCPAVPAPGAPDRLHSYRCHLPLPRRRFGDGGCPH